MQTWDLIARLILGANFFIFGMNGFLHRIPLPPANEGLERFVQSLQETGYLLTVVKLIEIAAGLCLLTGFFVPLAILALGPVVFVIVSAQLILNRGKGWGISMLTLLPYLILWGTRWAVFAPLFGL